MDEALQFPFVGGSDGDYRPAVTDRQHGIGLDDSGLFGPLQHLLQPFGGLPFPFADSSAHLLQFG